MRNPYLNGIYESNGDLMSRTKNDNCGDTCGSQVTFTPGGTATCCISAGSQGFCSNVGTCTLFVDEVTQSMLAGGRNQATRASRIRAGRSELIRSRAGRTADQPKLYFPAANALRSAKTRLKQQHWA